MLRIGNSKLLSAKDAFFLGAASPRTLANAIHDKVAGITRLPFPRRIVVHLANRCDFACPMCSIGQAREARIEESGAADLPFSLYEKMVEQAAPWGCYVDLMGGEPLLYKRLGDATRLLTEAKLLSYITTDGFRLKKKAAELVGGGLKVLFISLDGWDEDSQYQRGLVPGSFKAIVDGIAEVKKLAGRSPFPIVRIGTVCTKVNYHSIDKIADAVYEMGVRRWFLSPYFFMTDRAMAEHEHFKHVTGIGDQVMQHHIPGTEGYFSPAEIADLKKSIARLKTRLEGPLRDMRVDYDWHMDLEKYYSPRPPAKDSTCNLPFDRIDVHTDGRIAICGDGTTIGNLNTDTIAEAWRGEKYRRFRTVLDEHKVMPMCFRCCGIIAGLKLDELPAPLEREPGRLRVLNA